jgi:serine/threonine-protein kinase
VIDQAFILPEDVQVLSGDEIDPGLLERMGWEEGDFVVTRLNSRITSQKIDGDTAGLLLCFRTPRTVLEAVFRHSLLTRRAAEHVLQTAYPALNRLIQLRLLAPYDPNEAVAPGPAYRPLERIEMFEVIRCLQSLGDTEVYEARASDGRRVALKIEGREPKATTRAVLEREAAVLRHLESATSPGVIHVGMHQDKKFLVTEWCEGVSASVAADAIRRTWSTDARSALLDLCIAIVNAYRDLHGRAVTHCDVHPRNLLVTPGGAVKIIDFGLAKMEGMRPDLGPSLRAGVGFYFEPEYVRAHLRGEPAPAASPLGEQYQVAALLYLLLTGGHYLEFSFNREQAYRQIEKEEPLPFASRNQPAWPEVEQVLFRALSKSPQERFPSMAEFGRALESPAKSSRARESEQNFLIPSSAAIGQDFADSLIRCFEEAGKGMRGRALDPPICSVNYGAAGVAYMYYRLACIRDSTELLSRADLWCAWAAQHSGDPRAFYSPKLELGQDTVGAVSLYHTLCGVHCVQALVCQCLGNLGDFQRAVNDFIAASSHVCENLELTAGRCSVLVGAALLNDVIPADADAIRQPLLAFGNAVLSELDTRIASLAPMQDCREVKWLGMAHGWAGLLYAILRWCKSSARAVPPWLCWRMDELAAYAEPMEGRLSWRRRPCDAPAGDQAWPGWCHGSAGFVQLWSLAHQVFPGGHYLELAEQAAKHVWESTARQSGSLCCGLTGEAYSLLRVYKDTGDAKWVDRARTLALRGLAMANPTSLIPGSLYKGDIGLCLLVSDLSAPNGSAMPMFECETFIGNTTLFHRFSCDPRCISPFER